MELDERWALIPHMHRISLHHAMSLRECRYSHERHKRGKHKRNDWSNVIFPWHYRRKTTEDATSSNENKTAGRAFLRSVAFPLTTRTHNKITPTFFPLVLFVFHFSPPFLYLFLITMWFSLTWFFYYLNPFDLSLNLFDLSINPYTIFISNALLTRETRIIQIRIDFYYWWEWVVITFLH